VYNTCKNGKPLLRLIKSALLFSCYLIFKEREAALKESAIRSVLSM